MKKIIALVLFLLVVFFNVVILKPTADGTGNGLQVPDVTFTYDGQTIYDNFFLQLDPAQIPAYKTNMLWDYAYPVIYTAFLFLMGQILFKNGRYKRVFITAVVAAFLFDYAENLTQLYLLNQLPEVHLGLGTVMGLFTTMKWTTALFTLFSVIIALVRAGVRKLIQGKESTPGNPA